MPVEVVELPTSGPIPTGADFGPGDVLFLPATGSAQVAELADRGIDWMHIAGTGVDYFPLDQAPRATITCARGTAAAPIAEFVLASILAAEKQFPSAWIDAPPERRGVMATFGELGDKTLGLVGLGAIAQAVAVRALAFGMRVIAVRRTFSPSLIDGVEVVDGLAAMLPLADHVVVAAPATPATRHLLGPPELAIIRPGAHVVNIARGSLIDQDALLVALDDGRVGRASLDVTDPEPLPAGHPLYRHPHAFITPHLSWSSPHVADRWVESFTANLRRYLAGEPLVDVIDREQGY
jgi:phosphoglycerate dehydrogenase-like enzyme